MIPFTFTDFIWQSDFAGDEVGFPDVDIVGQYLYEAADGFNYLFEIDVENSEILSIFKMDDE